MFQGSFRSITWYFRWFRGSRRVKKRSRIVLGLQGGSKASGCYGSIPGYFRACHVFFGCSEDVTRDLRVFRRCSWELQIVSGQFQEIVWGLQVISGDFRAVIGCFM